MRTKIKKHKDILKIMSGKTHMEHIIVHNVMCTKRTDQLITAPTVMYVSMATIIIVSFSANVSAKVTYAHSGPLLGLFSLSLLALGPLSY